MSGKKGRSGRLPRAIELARARGKDDALSCVRRRLPQLLQVLVEKAEAGDKECAVYLVDRVLGRPRLELDQRLTSSVDVTLDPSRLLEAMREREQIEAQYHLVSEREPSDPTREESHAPVSDTPFREETISQKMRSANSTDSVNIPDPDRDVNEDSSGGWLDGPGT